MVEELELELELWLLELELLLLLELWLEELEAEEVSGVQTTPSRSTKPMPARSVHFWSLATAEELELLELE